MDEAAKRRATPGGRIRRFAALSWAGLALAVVGGVLLYAKWVPRASSEQADVRDQGVSVAVTEWRRRADAAYVARRWPEAIRCYEEILQRDPDSLPAWVRLAYSLHCSGQLDRALTAHVHVSRFPAARPWGLYNIACVYALQGEKQLALDYLYDAIAAGFISQQPVSEDPDLQSLVGEPQFEMLAEMAKPLPQRSTFRQFDFLVGRWYLLGGDGQRHGRMEIRRDVTLHGLLGEYWNNALPLQASIMSYYEPSKQRWHQIWVESGGMVLDLAGSRTTDQALVLEGTWTKPVGDEERGRAIYDVAPDNVQLRLDRSYDNGTTWETVVTSRLSRAEDDPIRAQRKRP